MVARASSTHPPAERSAATNPLSPALARAAVSGSLWVYLSYALGKLVTFGVTVVLARLLAVGDFGLVGYALIMVSYLEVVRDLGVAAALVAQPAAALPRVRSTAFWITLLAGATLAGLTVALAPLVGAFFGSPQAVGLIQVLGSTLAISSVGTTHDALLQRELEFRRRLAPELGGSLVKGLCSVVLAAAGFGAWAIAWGQVAGVLAGTALTWLAYPWRPRLELDLRAARGLVGFGLQLIAVNVLAAVLLNSDYLLVGRLLGPEALGLYTLAFRLPDLALVNLCWVLSRVLFPLFSRVKSDRATLRQTYLGALRAVALLVVPLGLGLVLTAPVLVSTVFGEKWLPSVPVLQLLAVYSTLHALNFHVGDVFKALGLGGQLIRFNLLSGLVLLPTMFGLLVWIGLPGVALAWILGGAIRATLDFRAIGRLLRIGPADLAVRLRTPALGGLALIAVVWPVGRLVAGPDWLILGVQVASGAVAYLGTVWLLDRGLLGQVRALVAVEGAAEPPTPPRRTADTRAGSRASSRSGVRWIARPAVRRPARRRPPD